MPLTACPAFRVAPTAVQLAADGDWERCQRWDITALPEETDWDASLISREEIAFELFFGAAFFGVRWTGATAVLQARVAACFAATTAAHRGGNFFADLSARTGLTGWGESVAFAEVGAVNAWKSVGAVRTEKWPLMEVDFETWWSAIARAPVARETAHRKAVEFACPEPVAHWFALPVSEMEPPFTLDRELLHAAIHTAAGKR